MQIESLEEIARAFAPTARPRPVGTKYQVLYEQILQQIESGEWRPGDRLPPEAAFARHIPVSLGTVQRALRLLADDGILVRRHGDGTYVATRSPYATDIQNFRFLDDEGRLLPVYSTVVTIDAVGDDGPWAEFLVEEERFVRVKRVVSVNREFDTFGEFYVSASRFGAFLDYAPGDLDGVGFTHLLAEHFNAPSLRFEQRIGFVSMPAHVAAAIGTKEGQIGMLWQNRAFSYRDAPLYYQRFYLPPNNRNIEVRN